MPVVAIPTGHYSLVDQSLVATTISPLITGSLLHAFFIEASEGSAPFGIHFF